MEWYPARIRDGVQQLSAAQASPRLLQMAERCLAKAAQFGRLE
jgi:hypothetical protein